MATFVLIHGAGDVGWYWHLVERELRGRGHEVVAPDLPCDDDSAGLAEYADTVADAAGDRRDLVVVGQSFGGFTAPLVAGRLQARAIVLVAGMIPAPGEKPEDWPANTGLWQAVREQARRDGGKTGSSDPFVVFYHDVPRALAEQAVSMGRSQSGTPGLSPWPLRAWPAVPTRFVLCTEDRFFPAGFMRRVVSERLGVVPDEIAAGHCVALSRPKDLTNLLVGYAATESSPGPAGREPGQRERGQGDVGLPGPPAAHLVVGQPRLALGLLEACPDMPAAGCGPGETGRAAPAGAVAGDLGRVAERPAGKQPMTAPQAPPGPDRDPHPGELARTPARAEPRADPPG